MKTFGDNDSCAAIFVYKDDKSIADAMDKARGVALQHYSRHDYTEQEKLAIASALGYDPTDSSGIFVYQVHADNKAEFLAELEAWSGRVDREVATLLIYAHSGTLGINRMGGDAEHRVTWAELAKVLSGGVRSLWLVGCKSKNCIDGWKVAGGGPVREFLVCTTTTAPWAKLIPFFKMQISLDPIYQPEKIADKLKEAFPDSVEMLKRLSLWKEG